MLDHQLITDFANYLKNQKRLSGRTVKCYCTDITQFCRFMEPSCRENTQYDREIALWYNNGIAGSSVSAVNTTLPDTQFLLAAGREDLQAFIDSCFQHGYSFNAGIRKVASLKAFYKFAIRFGYLIENPAQDIKVQVQQEHFIKILTDDQVRELFAQINDSGWISIRDKAIFELIYSTGIRVSELVALRHDSIDFMNEQVHIGGHGSKYRAVHLFTATLQAIQRYIQLKNSIFPAENNSQNILFVNRYGRPLTERSIRRKLDKYVQLAGLDPSICPNTLRHSFAAKMLDMGADAERIKEIFGHQSMVTAAAYVNLVSRSLGRNLIEKNGRILE